MRHSIEVQQSPHESVKAEDVLSPMQRRETTSTKFQKEIEVTKVVSEILRNYAMIARG